jgi:preprotein translocase subunit SecD
MAKALNSRCVQLSILLVICLCGVSVRLDAQTGGSLGIFEVVDCTTTGAKKMLLQKAEGNQEFCLAGKPIVDQTHLKDAKGATGADGRPVLELTLSEPGGQVMAKATQQMMEKSSATGRLGSLGLVIEGRLVSAADLRGVIVDRFVVQGNFTRDQIDEMVALLTGRPKKTPVGTRKT